MRSSNLLIAAGLWLGTSGCSRTLSHGASGPSATPTMTSILGQFTGPGVPALGPSEPGPTPHTWPEPSSAPAWPGKGIAQHPMLYAGEGYNTLFLVDRGKI